MIIVLRVYGGGTSNYKYNCLQSVNNLYLILNPISFWLGSTRSSVTTPIKSGPGVTTKIKKYKTNNQDPLDYYYYYY